MLYLPIRKVNLEKKGKYNYYKQHYLIQKGNVLGIQHYIISAYKKMETGKEQG